MISNVTPTGAWDAVAQEVAGRARQLHPWSVYLLIVVLGGVIWGDLLDPLSRWWRAQPSQIGLWPLLSELTVLALKASPTVALLVGLYSAQLYLHRLKAGQVWSAATADLLGQVGASLITSAALATLLVPNALRWIAQRGGFDLHVSTTSLLLAALGGLLILIAQLLRSVLTMANTLKAEAEGFV